MTALRWLGNVHWQQLRIPLLFTLTLPMLGLMEVNIDRLARGVDQPLYYSARLDEISKMDLEATRLFDIADSLVRGETLYNRDDLEVHLDVFWARVAATKTPSYMAVLGPANIDAGLPVELFDAMPRFDQAVKAVKAGQPESIAPLVVLKDRYSERLHRINEAAWMTRRKLAAEFAARNAANVAVLRNIQIGFIALALFILFYMLFELVSARRSNRRLNAMIAEKQVLLRTDILTGISNRSAFEADLAALCATPPLHGFSVIYLDLDGFKKVNDTLGHAAGDALLRSVADALRESAGDKDVISRLGGDEFALILPGPAERAQGIMARVAHRIASAPMLESGIAVSASIGLCHSGQFCGENIPLEPETLMRCADLALYAAKHGGRNRQVMFSPDLSERNARQNQVEALLPSAIRAGAIEAAFQPIIDIKAGRVASLEALVRWSTPELGPVPADLIVAVAERTGVIGELTFAMLRRAIDVSKRIAAAGHPMPIAVNLAPVLLAQDNFAIDVIAVLAENGMAPGSICFELVEYAEIDEVESDTVRANFERLMLAGIPLAIDDFGKAYSNLHRLMQIEFHQLKLDKALLSGIGETERAGRILHGLNGLMAGIGVELVGEGIETSEQLDLLRLAGIRYAQGYYFARPMSPDVLHDFLGADGSKTLRLKA